MPHIFSVEIHDYLSTQIRLAEERILLVGPGEENGIDKRLEDVNGILEGGHLSDNEERFQDGRITALQAFKEFLKSGYDTKLPRRLRGRV